MLNFHRLLSILSFIFIFSLISQADHHDSATINTTKLVVQVCNQTSNYTFCVEALYTDPRTPDADRYSLAYVSFGLAYVNATTTQDRITKLLKNATTVHDRDGLQTCQSDYKKAINALQSAFNDLDSETFFTLSGLANDTAKAAAHCQTHYPPLTSKTKELNHLSEICIAISKSFVTT
ncbi:hypothetical protein Patl1_09633 [Pistacia atlantica]|uniref:Uncharacterized protein n=1 Tax=Pistacia atlantica TaxID=434234 RepID=A0ACC1A604_9ROSI|nr:hypothetical protein Patl1_09633 [Pistacia atlantica]